MPAANVATFSEIRGHTRACDYLRTAVANERLPHALLFAGPEGIGKRCVALALVAWLQCECRTQNACGTCTACRQVAAGSHPDVQLVAVAPGKKEIGVDRVREVKRFMQLQPVRGAGKLVIIDDAHRLTVAAQNALLKTLEEPPAQSYLILVADSPEALLATVRSRCQRVQFSPLSSDAVVDVLTQRCGVDPALGYELGALAEGSPGHALALQGCLDGTKREQLVAQLAGLGEAGYVSVMRLASELSQPEAHAAAKLELILSAYRDDALRAIGTTRVPSADRSVPIDDCAPAVRAALRCADAVNAAWVALRRGAPNRQLLLEALLLRVTGV